MENTIKYLHQIFKRKIEKKSTYVTTKMKNEKKKKTAKREKSGIATKKAENNFDL